MLAPIISVSVLLASSSLCSALPAPLPVTADASASASSLSNSGARPVAAAPPTGPTTVKVTPMTSGDSSTQPMGFTQPRLGYTAQKGATGTYAQRPLEMGEASTSTSASSGAVTKEEVQEKSTFNGPLARQMMIKKMKKPKFKRHDVIVNEYYGSPIGGYWYGGEWRDVFYHHYWGPPGPGPWGKRSEDGLDKRSPLYHHHFHNRRPTKASAQVVLNRRHGIALEMPANKVPVVHQADSSVAVGTPPQGNDTDATFTHKAANKEPVYRFGEAKILHSPQREDGERAEAVDGKGDGKRAVKFGSGEDLEKRNRRLLQGTLLGDKVDIELKAPLTKPLVDVALSRRDDGLDYLGVPGYVMVANSFFKTNMAQPVAGLVYSADPTNNNSMALGTSSVQSTQFYLSTITQSFDAEPANSTDSTNSTSPPPAVLAVDSKGSMLDIVELRLPTMNSEKMENQDMCASFDTTPPSTMMLQECGKNAAGISQAFVYNTTTGELKPFYTIAVAAAIPVSMVTTPMDNMSDSSDKMASTHMQNHLSLIAHTTNNLADNTTAADPAADPPADPTTATPAPADNGSSTTDPTAAPSPDDADSSKTVSLYFIPASTYYKDAAQLDSLTSDPSVVDADPSASSNSTDTTATDPTADPASATPAAFDANVMDNIDGSSTPSSSSDDGMWHSSTANGLMATSTKPCPSKSTGSGSSSSNSYLDSKGDDKPSGSNSTTGRDGSSGSSDSTVATQGSGGDKKGNDAKATSTTTTSTSSSTPTATPSPVQRLKMIRVARSRS